MSVDRLDDDDTPAAALDAYASRETDVPVSQMGRNPAPNHKTGQLATPICAPMPRPNTAPTPSIAAANASAKPSKLSPPRPCFASKLKTPIATW